MRKLLFILITTLIAVSCGTSRKGTTEENAIPEPCEAIIFIDKPYTEVETDYYSLDSLFIENGCLNIWVSYGGGCGDAEFTLYYNNIVLESFPPKANLMLKLKDEDNCRAIVQQKLYYDLSFFNDYAVGGGINLKLAGIDNSVMYKE